MLAYIFHHRSLAGFLFKDKIGLQSTWDGGRESGCWLQVNLSSKFCNTSPKISPYTFERQQWLNSVLQGSSIFSPALLQGAVSCSGAKLPTSVHFFPPASNLSVYPVFHQSFYFPPSHYLSSVYSCSMKSIFFLFSARERNMGGRRWLGKEHAVKCCQLRKKALVKS